jgi:hypothetical protein
VNLHKDDVESQNNNITVKENESEIIPFTLKILYSIPSFGKMSTLLIAK